MRLPRSERGDRGGTRAKPEWPPAANVALVLAATFAGSTGGASLAVIAPFRWD